MLSRLNGMHTCEELAALIFQPLVDKLLLLAAVRSTNAPSHPSSSAHSALLPVPLLLPVFVFASPCFR